MPEPRRYTITDGLIKSRINHFPHHSIHIHWRRNEQSGSASHRNADNTNFFIGSVGAEKLNCCLSVPALQVAEGNVLSGTFPMSLKVKKKNSVASVRKKTRSIQHTQTIGAHTMHESYGSRSL